MYNGRAREGSRTGYRQSVARLSARFQALPGPPELTGGYAVGVGRRGHWAYYYIAEATNGHNYTKDSKGVETWKGLK